MYFLWMLPSFLRVFTAYQRKISLGARHRAPTIISEVKKDGHAWTGSAYVDILLSHLSDDSLQNADQMASKGISILELLIIVKSD